MVWAVPFGAPEEQPWKSSSLEQVLSHRAGFELAQQA
jgi:hypothetical protein